MTAAPSTKPRKRVFYLDLVRALAAVLVVITHFNNPYLHQAQKRHVFAYEPFGVYIGNLGVSLFLIISGAALMMTYGGPRLDLRVFYWKRFKGIYPMFWTAWILGTLYFFLADHGVARNHAPTRTFLFTFFGMDGMVANFHIQTMYLLGEWFLGFIVLFYIVFPLLRWAVMTYPKTTAAAIFAIYAVTFVLLNKIPHSFPNQIVLPLRLPELAFGMYFVRYVRRMPTWAVLPWVLPCAGILIMSAKRPMLNEDFATPFVGVACFFILAMVARYLDAGPVREPVALIAKYSYPIFLVHHVVISKIFESTDTRAFSTLQLYMLFAAMSVIVFGLSVGLHRLNANVVAFFTRAFDGVTLLPRRRKAPEETPPAKDQTLS